MGTIKTVNEESLVALGDAIRSKTGGEEPLVFPTGMVEAIEGIEAAVPVEPIVLTGECQYACAGPIASTYIKANGDTISTQGITSASYMFQNSELETIPFDLNYETPTAYYTAHKAEYLFKAAKYLTTLPKLNNFFPYNLSGFFENCLRLREIPEDYFDDWNFQYTPSAGQYNFPINRLFAGCYSLRKCPLQWISQTNPIVSYSSTYFYFGFTGCYALDELVDLPVPYTTNTWTSNLFHQTFQSCHRLKNLTFEMPNGTPVIVNWKSQTIDLTYELGYAPSVYVARILDYNSGITRDKRVTDDTTYQALKDDPDWFSCQPEYSRYNHDSAVNTINSLPDTSAYLATAGGTNTIKFKGAAGSATDGGAINTLTEEEIAVATAKGWTVSLV